MIRGSRADLKDPNSILLSASTAEALIGRSNPLGRLVKINNSLLIASPIAYYLMHNWLQKYQYQSELSGWIFLITGLIALLITLATVSYQDIRTALINPVKSLHSE